jgi:hypothetical protein
VHHPDSDWPTPHITIVDDKTRHEILILAGRDPVLDHDADNFVTGAFVTVPGTVLGYKQAAAILFRKLSSSLKRHFQ